MSNKNFRPTIKQNYIIFGYPYKIELQILSSRSNSNDIDLYNCIINVRVFVALYEM